MHTTLTDRNVVIPVDLTYHAGAALGAVLRDLPSSTLISNIAIKAVNFSGMVSEPTKLGEYPGDPETVTTQRCSRHALIAREMARCTGTKEQFIDTDFFTGIMQVGRDPNSGNPNLES